MDINHERKLLTPLVASTSLVAGFDIHELARFRQDGSGKIEIIVSLASAYELIALIAKERQRSISADWGLV